MPTTFTSGSTNLQGGMNDYDVLFKFGVAQKESNVFFVKEPVAVVLWLPSDIGDDEIVFTQVLMGDSTCQSQCGCNIKTSGGVVEIASIPYKICDCIPKLNQIRRKIVIDQAGSYRAHLRKSDGTTAEHLSDVLVMIYPETSQFINNEMRGCCA